MFKKIMVPLDGSKLAECALRYAETLAKNCKTSELVLVSVTEKVKGVTRAADTRETLTGSSDERVGDASTGLVSRPAIPGGINALLGVDNLWPTETVYGTSITFGKMEGPAWRYLHKIEKKMAAKGIPVKSEVLIGGPAEQITKYAEQGNFDLIVMSSHGRSGPSRWALGSVTDKVFRASCVPVMMIRAPGCLPGF